jgi:hypothetical protein
LIPTATTRGGRYIAVRIGWTNANALLNYYVAIPPKDLTKGDRRAWRKAQQDFDSTVLAAAALSRRAATAWVDWGGAWPMTPLGKKDAEVKVYRFRLGVLGHVTFSSGGNYTDFLSVLRRRVAGA